ncbi:ImmA/IrrE family metallo-endopeptidase [Bacillus sp. 1P06AnD]|uniref:ImmA/IrrE family metallo-endopeptidase n=1 Tax=Bacillus sp. 1P06AnD TaxID=3132208 RepID=UPI00399F936B
MNIFDVLNDIEQHGIELIEKSLPGQLRGMYSDHTILLDQDLTICEKKCILAEELGHHFMNHGDVLDKNSLNSIKQEILARRWGHHYIIPLTKIQITKYSCENIFQLAEELDVTEDFLIEAIDHYQQKYGVAI